jgi:predicted nucleotidyltransferase component of viral defense system
MNGNEGGNTGKTDRITNLAASVRQRLLNHAKAGNEDFQRVLTRYALERLLYRISRSPYADRFILKGALLFLLWLDEPLRRTKDLDLLGTGSPAPEDLAAVFRDLCSQEVPDDGLRFDEQTVAAGRIREENIYGGVRVTLVAFLDSARIPIQVDVGFGDVVTPAPVNVTFPVLLDFPAPELRAYVRETVIAEKLCALVVLDLDNSRMKDFYDLWMLGQRFAFDGERLSDAVVATFSRRGVLVPPIAPTGLTERFSTHPSRQIQWRAFAKQSLSPTPHAPDLREVVSFAAGFLLPILDSLRDGKPFRASWQPGGSWRTFGSGRKDDEPRDETKETDR